jgi:hypothetical protein
MSKSLAVVSCLAGLCATALADPQTPPLTPGTPVTPDETSLPAPPPPGTATDTVTPPVETSAPVSTEPESSMPHPVVDTTIVVDDGVSTYAWNEPGLQSGVGVQFTVGGGLMGFTDRAMRDTVSSDVAGLWDARLSLGTHVPIGLDVSYLGSAQNVNTLAGTPNGTLVGTTAEAALRWNILPHAAVTPYIFGGLGWQRYDLTNTRVAAADSGMQQSDNFLEVPMGLGFAIRQMNGFTLDARGTYRAQATSSDLVLDTSTGNFAKVNTWEASAALGYEF